MKMYYLIQDNLYNVANEENLILALQQLGLDFQYFKQIPFENKLLMSDFDVIPLDENVFLFGSVNSVQIASNTNYGVKIVECGRLNCAGFYKTNLQTLLVAIEDYYQSF